MLGVCLLFVGIVLINNGMCALYHVDGLSEFPLLKHRNTPHTS